MKLNLCLAAVIAALPASSAILTFSVGGDTTAASIQATVDSFRAALGGPVNGNAVGPIVGGRREVNWDAAIVPTDPTDLPGDFFNATVSRGLILSSPGNLRVPVFPVDEFQNVFSADNIFGTRNSNILDITFRVPGTNTVATTPGIGIVFLDHDSSTATGATTMELFDINGLSLGVFDVPVVTADQGLSFLGLLGDAGEQIARIRVITGDAGLDCPAAVDNCVAMDDFIYGEPVAAPVPEPATWMTAGAALLLAAYLRRMS